MISQPNINPFIYFILQNLVKAQPSFSIRDAESDPSFFLISRFSPSPPNFTSASWSTTMAGGAIKYRHLSRKSSHRQALLRNLVTSLFEHESIATTWHKAKEAQRLAEQLITLGKKNTDASRRRAQAIFYVWISYLFLPGPASSFPLQEK